ncbi:MAG: porin [Spirochaetes bacterium]|nr:porin [Spirochaetota bacterium]
MNLKIKLGIAAILFAAISSIISAQSSTEDGVKPYGQVRAYAGYVNQSKDLTETKSDTDYYSKLTTARIGLKGRYSNIDLLAELAVNSYGSSANSVITRKYYAVWNATDKLKVKIGQDDAPYTFYSSSITNDISYVGLGSTSQPRDVQIQINYGGAYASILNPKEPSKIGAIDDAKYWDVVSPKIAAGYEFKTDDGNIKFGAGVAFASFKIDSNDNAALDGINGKRANGILGYAHTNLKFGEFTAQANFGYGINTGLLGIAYSGSFVSTPTSAVKSAGLSSNPEIKTNGNGFEKTTIIEGYIELGYKFQSFEIRSGAGYVQAKNKQWDKIDSQIGYFLQAKIPVVEGRFNIIPEVFYLDLKKDKNGDKEGHELVAGSLFQIIF